MREPNIYVSYVGTIITLRQGTSTRSRYMKCRGKTVREAARLRKTRSSREAAFASWGAGDE